MWSSAPRRPFFFSFSRFFSLSTRTRDATRSWSSARFSWGVFRMGRKPRSRSRRDVWLTGNQGSGSGGGSSSNSKPRRNDARFRRESGDPDGDPCGVARNGAPRPRRESGDPCGDRWGVASAGAPRRSAGADWGRFSVFGVARGGGSSGGALSEWWFKGMTVQAWRAGLPSLSKRRDLATPNCCGWRTGRLPYFTRRSSRRFSRRFSTRWSRFASASSLTRVISARISASDTGFGSMTTRGARRRPTSSSSVGDGVLGMASYVAAAMLMDGALMEELPRRNCC